VAIVGVYIIRIYKDVRRRPQFIVESSIGLEGRGRPVLDMPERGARGSSERERASEASGGGAPRALNEAARASGVGMGPHASE